MQSTSPAAAGYVAVGYSSEVADLDFFVFSFFGRC
jgi:hypothetical protein